MKYNQDLLETVKVKNVIPLTRWPTCQPMRWSTHHRHYRKRLTTVPMSRLTCGPTHHQRVSQHTTEEQSQISQKMKLFKIYYSVIL